MRILDLIGIIVSYVLLTKAFVDLDINSYNQRQQNHSESNSWSLILTEKSEQFQQLLM